MAMKSYEPAGGSPTPAIDCRAQSAAGLHPARHNGKLERSLTEIETVDRADVPVHREISFGPFRLLPTRRLLLEDDKPVRLGTRALDLLIALAERPGEVISKSELIGKVWPHTFVVEGNLKLHIAALRRVLSDGLADNRYISTITGRGYCFVAPITQPGSPCSAAARHSEPLTNLPAPLMRLVGREESIGRVSTLLAHHRLVTLVGPGGIGKTSVAVATANGLSDSYEHGVWFADLTTISDPRLLPAALSSAMRLDTSGADSFAGLLSFLRDKRTLLVLDNCEHITEASAALAFQVLRTGPGVQILATSREPLRVEGERLHRLQSLEVPTVLSSLSAQQALDFPAVRLFVERAANVLGEFELQDADVSKVLEICQKLDGIPLAIELAAANIDVLGLGGIVSRLDHPLRLPASRSQTAMPRHQTLHSAMDWSYRLLSEEEQRALRQLSVFTDSFTMDAAARAVADRTYPERETVDLVVALVAKSLVAAEPNGSDTRLRLLAATRAYALERLAERRKVEAIARRQTRFSQHPPRAAAQRNQAASPVGGRASIRMTQRTTRVRR